LKIFPPNFQWLLFGPKSAFFSNCLG
jgi:hypothetical protein